MPYFPIKIILVLSLAGFSVGASAAEKAAEKPPEKLENVAKPPVIVKEKNEPNTRVFVYGGRFMDVDAVVKMTGLDLDPSLSPIEVKRRLETTNLFSRISVWKEGNDVYIIAREKTNWFVLPYFISSGTTIYGVAFGKSAMYGQDADFVGKAQAGSENKEAAVLLRDFSFRNTPWMVASSIDFEDSRFQEYKEREVVQRTDNWFFGGTIRGGYRFTPHFSLSLNNYFERHRVENIDGTRQAGFEVAHRWIAEYSNFYINEGLARGGRTFLTFEHASKLSDFRYEKLGIGTDRSIILNGEFNWIGYVRAERGSDLPRFQQYKLGGGSLRGFPGEQFRARHYYSVQNDFLIGSFTGLGLRFRPLAFADFAYVNKGGRPGVGLGMRVFFRSISVPAIQFFGGYGFNPNGFSIAASIGPQI